MIREFLHFPTGPASAFLQSGRVSNATRLRRQSFASPAETPSRQFASNFQVSLLSFTRLAPYQLQSAEIGRNPLQSSNYPTHERCFAADNSNVDPSVF
jgi:hypothetical protein